MLNPNAPSPFPPQLTAAARALCDAAAVQNLSVALKDKAVVFSASVIDRGVHQVMLSLEYRSRSEGAIYAQCSCSQPRPCVHIASLYFYAASNIGSSPKALLSLLTGAPGELPEDDVSADMDNDEMYRGLAGPTYDPEQRLRDNLEQLTVPMMRAIARRRNWPLKGTSKSAIIDQITVQILRSSADGTFLNGLSPKQSRFLSALHLAWDLNAGVREQDLSHTWRELLRERGDWRDTVTALCEYGALYHTAAGSVYRGLVLFANLFPAPVLAEWLPAPMPAQRFKNSRMMARQASLLDQAEWLLNLPEGVTLRLESLPAWQRPGPMGWPGSPQEARRPGDEMRGVVPFVLRNYYLTDEAADALTPGFSSRQEADWLVEVLLNLGLLVEKDGVARAADLKAYDEMTPAERWTIFLRSWPLVSTMPYELRCLLRERPTLRLWRDVMPTVTYSLFMREIVEARGVVLRCLTALHHLQPPGDDGWFELAGFLRLCQTLTPDLYRRFSGSDLWGITYHHQKDPRQETPPVWSDAYRHLVVSLLEGPLFWTGTIDLLKRGNETVALRLTPLGRWYASPDRSAELPLPSAAAQTPSTFTWGDDLTLTVQPGSEWQAVVGVLAGAMERIPDRPRSYRFSPTRLEGQFKFGVTAEQWIARAQAAGLSLPPAAVDYLTALHASYGRVHLYEAVTVIGFNDDYALAELRAAKLIRPEQVIHEFSPRLIAVPDSEVDAILRLLRSRNHTPQVVGS